MNYDYEGLETELRDLVRAITLNAPEIDEVEKFLSAGEYGLAFETLCGICSEENKRVPSGLRQKVRELAERMDIDPVWWENLLSID